LIAKKQVFGVLLIIAAILTAKLSWAITILESTYKKSGFKEAEALALSPQFSSLIYLSADSSTGSGSWIGNYDGHGYVLTAGHMFPPGSKVSEYSYWSLPGKEYHGEALFVHPLWNDNPDDRTGYDFAIVRLKEEVTDAGSQPSLYSGNSEQGKILVFIGYGWRGAGNKGEDTSIDTKDKPAAAEGLVESIVEAREPVPKTGDAGNYLAIWLPKEDGTLANPFNKQGNTKPASSLIGLIGSGDSGGPAWIQAEAGWAIAAVNSHGSGNAAYGDFSWFPRINHVQGWIKQLMPNAQFIK
jgi:hypothetical protein